MKREVKYAKLHQEVFCPGVGALKVTLEPKTYYGIKMYWEDGSLFVTYKGTSFVVPGGNVAGAFFSEPIVESVKAADPVPKQAAEEAKTEAA